MLILGRKTGEQIVIGTEIVVTVTETGGNYVKLGITAPAETTIICGELVPLLIAEIGEQKKKANQS